MKTLASMSASPRRSLARNKTLSKKRIAKPPKAQNTPNVRKTPTATASPNKSKSTTTEPKKKRKPKATNMLVGSKIFKISAKVLKEIKHCQMTVKHLVPRLPFARLIQEIIMQYVPEGRQIQREAINALQESAECYLTQYFEDSYACTIHARRSTLIPRDMALVEFLRKTI